MSIREKWQTMTARERDAEVARALGTKVQMVAAQYPMPESQEPVVFDHDCRRWTSIPYYSTSWADAGRLLEEMATEGGLFVGIQGLAEGGDWVAYCEARDGRDEFEVRCPAGPEAVALAYCLAKEKP